ncbi:virion structural protein [Synechococcus phage S-H9-1]|uniref:Structural protein n=1 Tax=Synechococcus phage S-H9-1 TaxID=2783674 RepID=A0A873WAT5_9CAUD|nr:virion structural protein [Synechococcus phage S-H9-1]QPB08260.1 structural protein [Synechococcus phage S-H9-1]
MSVTKKSISTLIESQLPEFISSEYELFSKFVTKYYEQQELQGQPLDVLSNLQTYADIDYYEKNILKQNTTLSVDISDSVTTINVVDASSFPEKNGYIQIGNEICFYKERTDTQFLEVSRGVSGNTKLGDLYTTSNFVSTQASFHPGGSSVNNVSNLFLYALVKSFESQYLGAFPQRYLKGEVDKRTLIKNIRKFYKAKGTDASVRFIFNTLVAGGEENTPSLYNPKDFTYKSSESDWVKGYALKVKVLSGDPNDLIGKVITQPATSTIPFASATVDNVRFDSNVDGEAIYNIFLAEETVNGEFFITSKTELTKQISSNDVAGNFINVFSTLGWKNTGALLIGNETFTFDEKNITQFRIKTRQNTSSYPIGTEVYEPIRLEGSGVELLSFGLVYNLEVLDGQPNSFTGDNVEIGLPGFTTDNAKIINPSTNSVRWKFNNGTQISTPGYSTIQQNLANLSTDVSALFEDEQYYYIASSGYPSYPILDGATDISTNAADQKLLKLIRKEAIRSTEIYETPSTDVGILVNGTRVYGHKDTDSVDFGELKRIDVLQQGSRYTIPPYVLIDGVAGKAVARLSGEFVESVEILEKSLYPRVPNVEILSGRNAVVRAVVTLGRVTSLVIDNPGEYYSAPPEIVIRDRVGRGRFAEYRSKIEGGKIVDFEVVNEGEFYSQDNIEVLVFPVGSGARGQAVLKNWRKNRYKVLESKLDSENGYLFDNYNPELEKGYGHVANPKALRIALGDNLNSTLQEPATKTHSPILGFAYDGNPIYGPFAYENPLDSQSSIVRMTSSYIQKTSRVEGPSISTYPLGTFIDDYEYRHRSGSLDNNNGRFCVTPDFPEGTYAYFLTIDSSQNPIYPYIIGQNFYSLPVDSNYNSNLSQKDLPLNARRFYLAGTPGNGGNVIANIKDIKSGSIDEFEVVSSTDTFSVGSELFIDDSETNGFGAAGSVSLVKGKSVNFLESQQTKATRLEIVRPAYLFAGDTLSQPITGAFGEVVGDVLNDNTVVLRNVQGTFDTTNTFSASIKVLSLLLNKPSSYASGSILKLTDGFVAEVAYGEVLETTVESNIVTVKVLTSVDFNGDGTLETPTGTAPFYFETEDNLADHYLQSNSLSDTSGTGIISITSLSDGLEPFDVNQNVALVETSENHGVGLDDIVNISINPDDSSTTTTYYVRKRIYQNLKLATPTIKTAVNYNGVGRLLTVNVGWDYTAGSYTNIPLTGGSGTGATANIVVNADGYVTDVQITDGGSGYKREDILSVDDTSLVRSVASQSTQRVKLLVDHVGVSTEATKIVLDDATRFVENDLVKIDDEIVKVISISSNTITVERAQNGTKAVDHYNDAPASLYKGRYNFNSNFTINGSETVTYDPNDQMLYVVYPSSTNISTLQPITDLFSFFDNSTPQRFVDIVNVTSPVNKFEFRKDGTSEYLTNPILEIQEYYKYRFDTSDSSLSGTYLDFSPSKNFNVIPVEKVESVPLPGSPNAFIDLKFGFGVRNSTNTYSDKKLTEFSNYYYFDRNGVCDSEGSYLNIITDPLSGRQVVNYVTPNRFCYALAKIPQWDGSGSITYTTNSLFAVGEISSVAITNIGDNYQKPPIISGVYPSVDNLAEATVLFDDYTKSITGVTVEKTGSNYSKPTVVITDGDGSGAEFTVIEQGGKVLDIRIKSRGKGYKTAPKIAIIEGDAFIFAKGKDIGVPKNVTIIRNGGSFHKDQTIYSDYTSSYTFTLKGYPEKAFKQGEVIVQKVNGIEVARGYVAIGGWREGSNLLKVTRIQGKFRENFNVQSVKTGNAGEITSIFVTTFSPTITSTYNNQGYYTSDRGRIGNSNQRITDSFFYQDYSYVIKSRTPITVWRDLIKSTTHPSGMKLFGEVIVDAEADIKMPVESPKASHFTVIELGIENSIKSENTRRIVTQTVQKIEDYRCKKGTGSVSVQEYNFNDLIASRVVLDSPFDGEFNSSGQLVGTRTFLLRDADTNAPVRPYNEQALIITLDGVLQEPGVSFTVSGDTITFAAPPLGEQIVEGQTVLQQKFLGKVFSFRSNTENQNVLKKIKNIYQRNGRWLDAANQIKLNEDFIVLETIGWFETQYSSVISNNTIPWNILEQRFKDDIRLILNAIEHDIRFGGNIKSVDYARGYSNTYNGYETYVIAAFEYAIRLARLAIRNWDWIAINASFTTGSDIVTVDSTDNVAIGAYVSAGSALPLANNIKVTEIISDTEVRISSPALATSGVPPAGSASPGNTYLSGTQSNNVSLPTGTGVVSPGNTYSVGPGTTLTAPPVFTGLNQVTFTFAGTNNGTFYDASNLINKNRDYIVDYAVNWAQATYPLINWTLKETKCRRDIGFLLDSVIEHLRYGGNYKIVEFAELYFIGSRLAYIDDQLTETLATYEKVLNELCVDAMRQSLAGTTPYTNIQPVIDPEVIADGNVPTCAGVESALNTYYEIISTIFNSGPTVVDSTSFNQNKTGAYTNQTPITNLNIIPDNQLISSECADVISSVDSLKENIAFEINGTAQSRSLPEYIDGETAIFDLYYEDGTAVNLPGPEDNLFVALNGVLQRPQFELDNPAFDAYFIDRSKNPNQIVFDSPPIWDQDFSALTIGEATSVEKFFAYDVGSYKRYTTDKSIIADEGTSSLGPFLILSVEDNKVVNIDDEKFLVVLVNGVIQEYDYAYTVSGPTITFKYPLRKEDVVDMRLLYGKEFEKIVTFYDHEPGSYLIEKTLVISDPSRSAYNGFGVWWNSPKPVVSDYSNVFVYQERPDGSVNPIGKLVNYWYSSGSFYVKMRSNNHVLESLDLSFRVLNDNTGPVFNVSASSNPFTLTTENIDPEGRVRLTRESQTYYKGDKGRTTDVLKRKGFFKLAPGDKVKIDGEKDFRFIKKVPDFVYAKEYRTNEDVTSDHYGSYTVTPYNGITRGEGLSVVAVVSNGEVVDLTWNQKIVDFSDPNNPKVSQPTAYQYYTPPILEFVPRDGNGGGARAEVIVKNGQVISVDLLHRGSGYTTDPKVVVTRSYKVCRENDIETNVVKVGVNKVIQQGITALSIIDTISLPPPEFALLSSVVLSSPTFVQDNIEHHIWPDVRESDMPVGSDQPGLQIRTRATDRIVPTPAGQSEVVDNQITTIIPTAAPNVLSTSTVTTSRNITTTLTREIDNTILESKAFNDPGAFLQIDLNIGDRVVYIPDTSRFSSNGKLLVGDEVIYYPRKYDDRFIFCDRGVENTTEQFWPAGTFLRQVPDYVSVVSGGINVVNSISSIETTHLPDGRGAENQRTHQLSGEIVTLTSSSRELISQVQVQTDIQSVSSLIYERTPTIESGVVGVDPVVITHNQTVIEQLDQINVVFDYSVRRDSVGVLIFTPPSGLIDYYQEEVLFTNPVSTRLNGFVTLIDKSVEQRSGNIIVVINQNEGLVQYQGEYSVGNLGSNIGNWSRVGYDDGFANVSNWTLQQFNRYFAEITINDFVKRGNSNFTLTGAKWNLANPSHQNSVAISSSSGTIGGPIIVQDTTYFPDSGYLLTSGGSVIQYTSKTATSFEDCTLYSGPNLISASDELVPFVIS